MFRLVVLTAVLASAAANPITFWGAGLASPLASRVTTPWGLPVFTPFASPAGPVAPVGALNYRGPLSLAPGQPANILAADGRPLDTLSVNLDRAVHNTARALEQSNQRLQKRSIVDANVVAANLAGAHLAAGPLAVGSLAAGQFGAGPLAVAPLTSTGLAVTPLTAGRSWVGPAPVALTAAGSVASLGLQAGAGLVL